MTRGEWILAAVGVLVWVWFLRQMFSSDGFFDKTPGPFECIGCQRHRVVPGCPVHDPEARRVS